MIHSSLSIDSLASNPRSSKFDFTHRQHQLAFLQRALDSTDPPPDDVYADSVPTSIAIAGPGSYGVKELDENGEDVILLNDDVLTSVANATVVVIDGNDLERITVLYQFPQFLEHCPQESINIMVPRICSEAVGWSTDAQLAACEALFYVVNVSVPYRIANHIACSALQITSDCADMHVFNACSELISTVLTQVHRYDVLQNVVPEAVDRAVSPAAHQRRLAARIIGALNDSLHAAELDAIFVKSALALSADREETVRAMTAQSLASIGRKVPLRVSERFLWPRLNDLIMQDVVPVRAAALRALAHSAEAHREHNLTCPSFDTIMKPLFIAECDKAADVSALDLRVVSDDKYLMLEVFSETFGHFLCALAPLLSRDRLWGVALTALRLMVTCNGPTVRHWCAYNMPAVAMHVRDADRAAKLTGVIPSLASDSDVETRSTLAAGIHELTRCLRKGALRPDVIRAIGMLFMDDNAQVRMNALSHFSDLLILLSNPEDDDGESQPDNSSHSINGINNSNTTSQQQQRSAASTPMARMSDTNLDSLHSGGTIHVGDNVIIRYGGRMLANNGTDEAEMRQLVPMFSSLELMSFDSWRTQRLLAEEVEKSAHLIPQAMLCEHVAPLLFQMARESTFLVRKASMRSLIHVIRYVPDVRRRNHILKHFKSEWAKGRVYWTRLAFIDAAECAYRVFSLRLFTALFRDEILALRNDLVVNVRLRLLKLLRTVAPVWSRLTAFRDVVDHLCGDGDWQVSNEARELRVFLHQREQQLQQRRQEQQLQQQQRQQQQGLPVTITPPSGLELLDLTKEELQLDATKEQAELRFFKHHKTKKRGKKSGRHSSKLRASVNSNNPGGDSTNNVDGAATPGNDLSMTSRSHTQSGVFTTADELADLETKTSHGLLTLDEVDAADANSSAGVGVHSGRIRTRSVIDSNGSTYGRQQQQQQQQQQLSAGMSMALEDMFGAGDATSPAGGPNSGDSKSAARRRSRGSAGIVGAAGPNNHSQRLSGSASSSAAVALAVAASAGAAPGANNNSMVNGSGTAAAGGAAGRKKKKHAHGGGPGSAGLEQDGEEEHAQQRQQQQQRNSLGRTSRTSSNSAMASQSPSTANTKTRRRMSGHMADGDATTTPTATTASTMRGAAANSAIGSAAAASAAAAATSGGAQAQAQAQTPAQTKGGFWATLCSCFGGGDAQHSERR